MVPAPSFILTLLCFLALFPASHQFIRNPDKVATQISQIRKTLVGKTLMLRWKLAEEDNFRLNAQNTMINKQSEQRKRSSATQSFFLPLEIARRGWAFFEAPKRGIQPEKLYVQLYDNEYSIGSKIIMEIPLKDNMKSGLNVDEDGYMLYQSQKPQFISCLLFRGDKMVGKFNIEAKIEIDTNIEEAGIFTSDDRIWLNFYSKSLVYYSDLQPVTTQYDLFAYLTLLCSMTFLVLVLILKPKRTVYNLSEWMIIQTAAYVLATNIILLGVGFARLDTRMWLVTACAFINIGLSLFFLRNYQDVVWNQFNTRRRVLFLVLFLGIYFALVSFYWKSQLFWIYEGFILFANQISYAYSKGGRGGMAVKLVLTILVTRIPFSYYRFIMEEVTTLPNNPILIVAFIGSNIILLTFIALQRYFGSRFLIPKELIPDYFDYFLAHASSDTLKEQCSICSVALGEDPDKADDSANSSHASVDDSAQEQIVRMKVSIMKTPCDHSFHSSCLQDWMDKRLNCPMCRTTLPPSEQQRDDSYCC